MWSEPVPKDSSPQMDSLPASIKFPKNFHPVGTSKYSMPFFCATKSIALLVGILLASPFTPVFLKYGITSAQCAMIATESLGVTNAPFP